ncbi:MAG: hypothetical protein R3C04_08515 [Hyphomonas sp.]
MTDRLPKLLQEIFVEKDARRNRGAAAIPAPPVDRLMLAAEKSCKAEASPHRQRYLSRPEARRRTEISIGWNTMSTTRTSAISPAPIRSLRLWYGTEEMIRADGVLDFDPQISIQPIEAPRTTPSPRRTGRPHAGRTVPSACR